MNFHCNTIDYNVIFIIKHGTCERTNYQPNLTHHRVSLVSTSWAPCGLSPFILFWWKPIELANCIIFGYLKMLFVYRWGVMRCISWCVQIIQIKKGNCDMTPWMHISFSSVHSFSSYIDHYVSKQQRFCYHKFVTRNWLRDTTQMRW